MAATKSTGVTGGERRRKPRGAAAAPALADGEWLGRLDALADQLAGLDDRGTIIDHVVSETMKLLPADQVVVHADDEAVTVPLFTEENEGAPARALIPIVIAGRRFGAVEIAMKPSRSVSPGERTLSIALARQCALALDSLALRKAHRAGLLAESVHAPVEEPVSETAVPVAVTAAPAAVTPPPVALTSAPVAVTAAPAAVTPPPVALTSAPVAVTAAPAAVTPPPVALTSAPVAVTFAPVALTPAASADVAAVQATIARLEADVRALAKLARSAELPPTTWVDQAERKALRDLEDLRAQLPGAENAA